MKRTVLWSAAAAAAAAVALSAGSVQAVVTANAVVDYTPGNLAAVGLSAYANPASALGPLAGDTGGGSALTPFNPAFSASQLAGVGPGGQLTVHLSSPVPTAGGRVVGVVSNNGIIDVSGGSGVAGDPAQLFSDPSQAVVSVSGDGVTYVTLNGGSPITFDAPANVYTDRQITGYNEPLGSAMADQSKPFAGSLASFNGETFDQIKATLNGSTGGTWLDLSGTGLAAVNDVRFDVPAGASYRFVADSVSGVPEPTTGAALVLGGLVVGRRRRR